MGNRFKKVICMDSNPATNDAIQLSDLRLTLHSDAGAVDILNGIDLNVASGETLGVVGPSGSGKTSLLMVMAGLEPATSGDVRIAGQPFQGLDEDALARFRRDQIGIVFQSFHLVPTMTALENVALPMEFAGRDGAFEKAEAELRAVGLADRLAHYPGQLSGGEQQRIALPRSLVQEPEFLLLDEPLAALDVGRRRTLRQFLAERLRMFGRPSITVTHDVRDVAALGAQIVAIEGGRIVQQGSLASIREQPASEFLAEFVGTE